MVMTSGRASFHLREAHVTAHRTRTDRVREFAQEGPATREVGRERERDQDADRFDRLHAEQVDAGPAAGWSGAEQDERERQRHGDRERRQHEPPQARILEVDERGGDPDRTPGDDAAGHRRDEHHVAQRIAQRDHRHQAETGQQMHRRQQDRIADAAGIGAHGVNDPETRHESGECEQHVVYGSRRECGRRVLA